MSSRGVGLSAEVSGFVLIGGRSRRLGFDKATAEIRGGPAADFVASVVGSMCSGEVRLVGRPEAPWSSYRCIPDDEYGSVEAGSVDSEVMTAGIGPIAGVATALGRASGAFAMIVATDLWNLGPSTLAALLSAIDPERGRDRGSAAVDVAYAEPKSGPGRGQPLCAVWRVATCLPVIRQRIRAGELSLFGLVDALRSVAVPVDDAELLNVNEPEDLADVRRDVSFLRGASADR